MRTMTPGEWPLLAALAALVVAFSLVWRMLRRRREMRHFFALISNQVLGGRSVRNPLVCDADGWPEDAVHVGTIRDSRLRRRLTPRDWLPGRYQTWTTDVWQLAKNAFALGHDAFALTNIADGGAIVVMPLGQVFYLDGDNRRGYSLR